MRKFFVLVCAHGGLEVRGRRPRAHSPTPTMPPPTNEVDEGFFTVDYEDRGPSCCPHVALITTQRKLRTRTSIQLPANATQKYRRAEISLHSWLVNNTYGKRMMMHT